MTYSIEDDLEIPGLGKGGETAVVGAFDIVGETAGRELFGGQVILQAVTTDSLTAATGVGAVALVQILILFTFHSLILSSLRVALYGS